MGNVSNPDGTLTFPSADDDDDDEKGPHSENGFFTMSALYAVCLQYLDHLESLIEGGPTNSNSNKSNKMNKSSKDNNDKGKQKEANIMTVLTENLNIAKKQISKFDARLVNTQTFVNDELPKTERKKSRKRKQTNPFEETQRERMKNAFPYGLFYCHFLLLLIVFVFIVIFLFMTGCVFFSWSTRHQT